MELTELEHLLYEEILLDNQNSFLSSPYYIVNQVRKKREDLYKQNYAQHLKVLFDLGLIKVSMVRGQLGCLIACTPSEIAQHKTLKSLGNSNKS